MGIPIAAISENWLKFDGFSDSKVFELWLETVVLFHCGMVEHLPTVSVFIVNTIAQIWCAILQRCFAKDFDIAIGVKFTAHSRLRSNGCNLVYICSMRCCILTSMWIAPVPIWRKIFTAAMQIGILQSFLSERLLIHWFEPTRHISNRAVQKLLLLPLS